MNIIGICGPAGSGKDTAREVLTGCFNVTGMAFADPMRAMLGALIDECGISREWMVLRDLKEQPMPGIGVSYRHAAQTLGTEWGRQHVSEDVWVRIALRTARIARLSVIPDVRFDNEAQAVRAAGGSVWRVVRPGVSCLDASSARHSSERGSRSYCEPLEYLFFEPCPNVLLK
jgi:hypothetical protein